MTGHSLHHPPAGMTVMALAKMRVMMSRLSESEGKGKGTASSCTMDLGHLEHRITGNTLLLL